MSPSVFLVVYADYDTYSVYGVYHSRKEAEQALKDHGFRIYKRGGARGLWSQRGWWYPLTIDEYAYGWGEEERKP